MHKLPLALTLLLAAAPIAAQQSDHRHDAMTRRGDAVMGFSHDTTVHHFRLRAQGGEIEAFARDANDAASAAQIRGHMTHIAQIFGDGNFTAPMLIHAQNPPGVDVMIRLKADIGYAVDLLPAGARVRISTSNLTALDAIHAFLRFQITEHKTGDPLTIQTR